MNMEIRKSEMSEVSALCRLFDEARGTIKQLGIDQWQNGYPSADVILADIESDNSYIVTVDGELCAAFTLIKNGEPTYDQIFDGEWLTGFSESGSSPCYYALHRVAVSVKHRGHGISTAIIDHSVSMARLEGKTSLRIDTHRGNIVMRKMLEKHGFLHCGTIFLANGDERVAYERLI